MSYYAKRDSYSTKKIKVELNVYNYAIKSDLKI